MYRNTVICRYMPQFLHIETNARDKKVKLNSVLGKMQNSRQKKMEFFYGILAELLIFYVFHDIIIKRDSEKSRKIQQELCFR